MHPEIASKIQTYPAQAQEVFLAVRKLIMLVAETEIEHELEETLKWGEPSYLIKGGSTIRIDWKASEPDYFCVFFNCKTSLVMTIKELYGDTFLYKGSRTVMLSLHEALPEAALKHSFSLALRYHKLKHLPLLGC